MGSVVEDPVPNKLYCTECRRGLALAHKTKRLVWIEALYGLARTKQAYCHLCCKTGDNTDLRYFEASVTGPPDRTVELSEPPQVAPEAQTIDATAASEGPRPNVLYCTECSNELSHKTKRTLVWRQAHFENTPCCYRCYKPGDQTNLRYFDASIGPQELLTAPTEPPMSLAFFPPPTQPSSEPTTNKEIPMTTAIATATFSATDSMKTATVAATKRTITRKTRKVVREVLLALIGRKVNSTYRRQLAAFLSSDLGDAVVTIAVGLIPIYYAPARIQKAEWFFEECRIQGSEIGTEKIAAILDPILSAIMAAIPDLHTEVVEEPKPATVPGAPSR